MAMLRSLRRSCGYRDLMSPTSRSRVAKSSRRHPSRIYWARRLLVLGVLVIAVSVAGWLVIRNSPGATKASAGTPKPSAAQRTSGNPSAGGTVTTAASQRSRPGQPCDPAKVDISVQVANSRVGRSNPATLVLTSRDAAACTLEITPSSLVVQVTSGPNVVWSSSQCPNEVLARKLVVHQDPPSAYEFTWNGRSSTDRCRGQGKVAAPGSYWLDAALVGGEPSRARFAVTKG